MNPAFSVIFFTTLAGAAQGLVVALAVATLAGAALAAGVLVAALARGGRAVLLVAASAPRFLHLGPARARLARRADVAHLVAVARGDRAAGLHRHGRALVAGAAPGAAPAWRDVAAAARRASRGAALLWYCTAMIYACLRFIEEWAHPLTLVNYTLIGLSSGLRAGAARWPRWPARRGLLRRGRAGRSSRPLVAWRHARAGAAPQRRAPATSTLQSATGIRRAAAGADVDGHVGRLVQHARVLPSRREPLALRQCASWPAVVLGFVAAGACCWRWRLPRRARRCCAWLAALLLQVAGPARRPLVLLRAGQAPAEPVLPGRVLSAAAGTSLPGRRPEGAGSEHNVPFHPDPAPMPRTKTASPDADTESDARSGSSAERSLRLLALLADAGRPLSLADLAPAWRCRRAPRTASAPSCSRAATWRATPTRAPSRSARRCAGWPSTAEPRRRARPAPRGARALVAQVGETCNFTTLDGTEVLYLDRVEAKWPLRLTLDVGSHVPLHCTASGKLFLAHLPEAQRDTLIERLPLEPMTPQHARHGRGAEGRVRARSLQQDCSYDREEFMAGLIAVAVPVRDAEGRVRAAIAVHGPTARLSLAQARAALPALRHAAERMGPLL